MSNLRDVLPTIKDLEPSEDRILWRCTDIPSLVEMLAFEYLPQATDFGKFLCLIYTKTLLLPSSFRFLGGHLKTTADETLFLELALRGYDLSKLRNEGTTAEIVKI